MSVPDYREERTARLRELTADHPAHAAYLERLLESDGDDRADTYPRGVSRRVGEALEDDVTTLVENRGGFGAYERARTAARRAARDRVETIRRREESLEGMLPPVL